MRKLKVLWRNALSPHLCEELETWLGVLLVLVAALLLYATLKAQAASAAEFPSELGAPTLLFQSADGSYAAAAPLQTDLRISVAGVVARVRVAQRFRNSGTALRRGGLRAAARRRCGRRSIADASRRTCHRRRDSRASASRANLRRSAGRRPTREPRAANERESVHDGGGQYRPRRDDRHHDRIPPDGAL